jgi:nitroreductase
LSSLVRTGQSSSFAADAARYEALISVLRDRVTARAFNSDYHMPREHIELVMDAAAQAPSGANAQPWQYVAVTNTVSSLRSTRAARQPMRLAERAAPCTAWITAQWKAPPALSSCCSILA